METKIIYRHPLGNPKRKWKQDNFVISTFRASEKNNEKPRLAIQNCKDLGFTMLEFASNPPLEDTLRCMVACEEVGIDGIFMNMQAFGGFQNTDQLELNKEAIEEFAAIAKKYRRVGGYYVWDEPIGEERLKAAREQTDYFESIDPERLPFTVALPSYNVIATWENGEYPLYIEDFARIIQPPVLSMDYYPFKQYRMPGLVDQLDSSKIFLDLGIVRRVAKKYQMPMWFYFQSQDNPHGRFYTGFTPGQLRSQQFISLLYGCKGLQNYNVCCGALNRDGSHGPLYWQTMELNRTCNQWGRTLMALESEYVFHSSEVLKGNEHFAALHNTTAESKILAKEDLPFRCSVGELADKEGNRYLLIQNRDYENERCFEIKLQKKFRVYEVSKKTGEQELYDEQTDRLSLCLEEGDAIFLRFQNVEEEPFAIDYILKK